MIICYFSSYLNQYDKNKIQDDIFQFKISAEWNNLIFLKLSNDKSHISCTKNKVV